jgi:hypothetical protein
MRRQPWSLVQSVVYPIGEKRFGKIHPTLICYQRSSFLSPASKNILNCMIYVSLPNDEWSQGESAKI